jgi:hypothetical protein
MKTKFIETSFNHYILFSPNETGKVMYRNYIHGLVGDKLPQVKRDLKIDEQGICKMQLWEFMTIFGTQFGVLNAPANMQFFIECVTPETYRAE